ncbi:MAG: gfo/Idh/MocA family oxidoreductase [PS1 clade bacterium]|uniref:Gfo/Idh/MocA family oxidoreductase n=1 Tax=PS1 clade bacterium TaxID=2175152 RepID=A0A368DJ10_9PROT|nr:MAG: gfo/Idh/MocA family oxidoreductase [PS1 clade bacterium]
MIRAASVGLGWWGKTLANSIQNSEKINVVMATTKTLNNIEDYCKEIDAEIATSYDEVVKSDKVDAVILATPHSKHLEQIVQAVNNGKHVFCEKPITLTAADAKIAFDEAKKNNKILAVGFNRRFHPNFMKIIEMVKSNTLGKIVHIEGTINAPGLWMYKPESWRSSSAETPAGGMTGMGIHVIDQMISANGDISSAYAQTAKVIKMGELDEVTSVLFKFANGATGYLGTSIASSVLYNFRVIAENGAIEITSRDLSVMKYTPREGDIEITEVKDVDMCKNELEAFADAVNGHADYPVTAEQGIHGAEVFEAVIKSAEKETLIKI